jgi:hypothetical protein
MKKLYHTKLMLVALLFFSACGTTTSVTGSYVAPNVNKTAFKKVFIAALTPNTSARNIVESQITDYLNSRGIAATKSLSVFPANFHSSGDDKDQALVIRNIRRSNCDGILTIALVNKETETRYVPGTSYPVYGYPYYGSFSSYYAYGYNTFYSPGYYDTSKIYYIETNLYDTATEKLVWSAQSKTYDPTSLDSFLESYKKAITQQFLKDGFVNPYAKNPINQD